MSRDEYLANIELRRKVISELRKLDLRYSIQIDFQTVGNSPESLNCNTFKLNRPYSYHDKNYGDMIAKEDFAIDIEKRIIMINGGLDLEYAAFNHIKHEVLALVKNEEKYNKHATSKILVSIQKIQIEKAYSEAGFDHADFEYGAIYMSIITL
jgi:hypothetical protein